MLSQRGAAQGGVAAAFASILPVKKKVNTSGILQRRKTSLWGLKSVNVKPSPIVFLSDFLNYGVLACFAVIFVFIFWGS